MMEIRILDPCTSVLWREFVESNRHAVMFHHPAWLSMLKEVYGYRPFAVCAVDGTCIKAGIPFAEVNSPLTGKRWISVPFSDFCAPLIASGDQRSMDMMMKFLFERSVEIPKIEIRWRVTSSLPIHYESTFVYHELPLHGDAQALFESFDRSTVYGIKRSIREGLQVKECTSYEEFEPFYELQVETRKRLGVPAQPKKFFKAVWNFIVKPGHGFALVAFKSGVPIGGGIFFKLGERVSYKYGAASYAHRGHRPTHSVVWEAIQRSCNGGYKIFDFGRSEVTNTGLREFKNGWGTIEHDLDYTILADDPPKSGPSRLMRLAGALIRNSPKVVCRMSGEVLYKHFA